MTAPLSDNWTWTGQQADALRRCAAWLNESGPDAQVFRLFGYAGTGKTTLARHLAETRDGDTIFAAFTGKAASVMRASGCVGAQTLHSLLYTPVETSKERVWALEGKLRAENLHPDEVREIEWELRSEREKAKRPSFVLNPDSALANADLLVVDEVSMVNGEMKRDILSFGKKVLVLGDPAQLPPVTGEGAFTNERPHILLTDIQRQARDNPIIRWAHIVREGGVLQYGTEGPCRKIRKADINAADLVHRGGQLLSGRNDSRRKLNLQARRLMGVSGPYPNKTETLVCLRNNHKLGLLNGVTCVALSDAVMEESGLLSLDLNYEDKPMLGLNISSVPFDIYSDAEAENRENHYERIRNDRFDFGYCLTVHKSQGSQWEKVTLCDDGFAKRNPVDRNRWLYTAITRAQKELVIVA
jgi:exodeoxyribonuclease-5